MDMSKSSAICVPCSCYPIQLKVSKPKPISEVLAYFILGGFFMLRIFQKWQRDFYAIWCGQVVSLITSSIVQYAVIWELTVRTKSAAVLSIASLVGFLPMALFSPFIGGVVDRFDRKKIMIFSDIAIAMVAAVLVLIGLNGEISVGMIMTALFTRAVGSAFHQPCLQAVTPLLVPSEHLTKCNGYTYSFQSLSLILSPAIAAALYPVLPLHWLISLDVIGAIAGIVPLLFIKIPKLEQMENKAFSFVEEAKEGIQVLYQNRGLFYLMLIGGLFSFAYIPANRLYPLLCMEWFGGTTTHAGIIETLFSVGTLSGGFLLGLWGGTKNKMQTMVPALAVIGGALVCIGILPVNGFILFVILSFITGLAAPFFSSVMMSLIQSKIETKYLGRVLGITTSIMSLACPIGLSFSGLFADSIGANRWVSISGILTMICVMLCRFVKSVWSVDTAQNTEA